MAQSERRYFLAYPNDTLWANVWPRKREFFYALTALCLWIFAMNMDYSSAQVTEQITQERSELICKENTRIAAGALNGDNISWIDPFRGEMVTMCRSYEAPVVAKK